MNTISHDSVRPGSYKRKQPHVSSADGHHGLIVGACRICERAPVPANITAGTLEMILANYSQV